MLERKSATSSCCPFDARPRSVPTVGVPVLVFLTIMSTAFMLPLTALSVVLALATAPLRRCCMRVRVESAGGLVQVMRITSAAAKVEGGPKVLASRLHGKLDAAKGRVGV
jgi:hypothetical protein